MRSVLKFKYLEFMLDELGIKLKTATRESFRVFVNVFWCLF